MKRFFVYDHYNGDHEFFDTIEEAKEYLKDCIQDDDGVFCEDPELSAIFELHTGIKIEILEWKEDYESQGEEWPYDNDWDYMAKKHVNRVKPEEKPAWIMALEIIAEGDPISVGLDEITKIANKGLEAYREQFEEE